MNKLEAKISAIYDKNGLFGAFNYIMSSEQTFLFPRNLIDPALNKAKELALLCKGERTLIWFINNYDSYKNRSIVDDRDIPYNSTIERKLSLPQIKLLKSKVKKLLSEQLSYHKTFNGVVELDRDTLQKKSVKIELSNIFSLYTAIIPAIIDYDTIINELSNNDLIISKQDLLAFISLILERETGNYFSIPYAFWCAFFGSRNVVDAKLAFEKQGLITMVNKALPGFKSASYKISLPHRYDFDLAEVIITNIRTLEKLHRIKYFKSNYTLHNKIKALKILTSLHVSSFESSEVGSKKNLTSIFLRSGIFGGLISDLKTIEGIINESVFVVDAHYLASHILVFLKKTNSGNFTRYAQFNSVKKDNINSSVKVLLPEYDIDDGDEISEAI